MELLALQDRSLAVNIAAFAIAAGFVWAAGTRLSRYVDKISTRTGIGAGFLGLLVLGGMTSLPEFATVSSASLNGNAPLAVNNVLGSAAINIVFLAVADAFLGRRALTSIIGDPTPLLQGMMGILLLSVVVMGVTVGDTPVLGVGLWSASLLPLFILAVWLNSRYQSHRPWAATEVLERQAERQESSFQGGANEAPRRAQEQPTTKALVLKTAAAGLVILIAGYVLATSGDAIAAQTGISSSLVGAVLVGFATGLPEVSSVYAAVKLERYSMALGDIFGTNIFNFVLIFLADAIYQGEPVLNQAGPFEVVVTTLTIVLTAIYLIGLLERKDRTILRMGYPSLAIIVTYAAGLFAMARIQ